MNVLMKNCDEIPKLFSLDLDQALDDTGRSRLNRHLTDCSDCASLVAHMRAVDRLFRNAPMKYAPLGFTERAVTAAFDAELRRNVGVGLGILLMGTVMIGSLFLLGRIDVLWTVLSALVSPGFLNSVGVWANEALVALTLAGGALWSVLGVFRTLLTGPLLVPSLISLLAAIFIMRFLQRTGARDTLSA
ncbi:MAG TPA: hypothetical protein VF707_09645 [Ardenticatenaceae bacterium]|jgi:anti-sigma factor RsiW